MNIFIKLSFIPFLILLFNISPCSGECARPHIEVDTLDNGSFVVLSFSGSSDSIINRDTLSPSIMLSQMISIFDSVQYSFIGEIDSIKTFITPINDTVFKEMDSVHIIIDSTLKGNFQNDGLWLIDSLYDNGARYNEKGETIAIVWTGDGPGSYRLLIGESFLLLTDSTSNIRKTGLIPVGSCIFYNQGYFINSNGEVSKTFYYAYPNIFPGPVNISIHLADFLHEIPNEIIFFLDNDEFLFNHKINIKRQNNDFKIIFEFKDVFEYISVYNIKGKHIKYLKLFNRKQVSINLKRGNYFLKIGSNKKIFFKQLNLF